MKKLLSIVLIFLMILPMVYSEEGDIYEFTEENLKAYTQEVIEGAYAEKDLEIADLRKKHEFEILDKDEEIEKKDAQREADMAEILGLKIKTEAQEKLLKWTPWIVVGSVTAGIVGGILIGRNID